MISLRWVRSEARWLAWGDAGLAGINALGVVAAIASGHPVAAVPLVAWLVPFAWGALLARSMLRSPAPELRVSRRGVVLHHPELAEPFGIASEEIHSFWLGPFDQPPARRADLWLGRRTFPARVLDVSGASRKHADADRLVIAFVRPLSIQPRLRLPRVAWFLHRAVPTTTSVLSDELLHGLTATVVDRDAAAAAIRSTGRISAAMPDDVRAWLSYA